MKVSRATEIPAEFLQQIACLLGNEYPAFLRSLQLPAISGLRVNTLKISGADFSKTSNWGLTPVPWCPSGFVVDLLPTEELPPQPSKHPHHAAGLFYLQEPSAMAAAELLAPKPGEKVLDLAAAPGGKATHLAALMDNSGLLVTNEIHPKRVWDLVENLERCGVTNAIVLNESTQRLADQLDEYFDRVMLDAPCSGEGMFRKGEVARQEWKPGLVHSCASRQASILEQASRLVKSGGRLAYTTCTFSPEENESVIAKFLVHHAEFDLESIRHLPGFSAGRPEWIGLSADDRLNRTIRIWPHLTPGEGHFIAILVRQDAKYHQRGQARSKNPSHKIYAPSTSEMEILEAFCQDVLTFKFDAARLAKIGSYMYYLPEDPPDLDGLRQIHHGWWLGSIHKGRFIPSHSLAMGIKSDQARHTVNFDPTDPQLSSYLAGETFQVVGEATWVLICVDGFPIGWGNRVSNVVKNFYPRGLRRRY